MELESFVREKLKREQNTEAVTLRIPVGLLGDIDELAATLGVTRSEFIFVILGDGIQKTVKIYEEKYKLDKYVSGEREGPVQYYFLNTNKRNEYKDHLRMTEDGTAEAFYDPWKFYIQDLHKGDVVFLYESGMGIVGTGTASGDLEIEDYEKPGDREKYKQKLNDYRKVEPLSAREIKKLTGSNMVFLKTMFGISEEFGLKILANLK
jgi:hypothetical protein